MRILMMFVFIFWVSGLLAQPDSLPAGVYLWKDARPEKTSIVERKNILEGSTRDLSNLEIHSIRLNPRQSAGSTDQQTLGEKLIIVKEGFLTLTIKDSTALVGPGSVAVINAGEMYFIKNVTALPLTYYSITYTSRSPVNPLRAKEAGGSFTLDWNELVVKQTEKGESRPIFDRPSSMFSKFDMHATALNAGITTHEPHRHHAEEIIVMIKGEVQIQIEQKLLKATSGDVIFYPGYSLHTIKNTGSAQCGYFAIQWRN